MLSMVMATGPISPRIGNALTIATVSMPGTLRSCVACRFCRGARLVGGWIQRVVELEAEHQQARRSPCRSAPHTACACCAAPGSTRSAGSRRARPARRRGCRGRASMRWCRVRRRRPAPAACRAATAARTGAIENTSGQIKRQHRDERELVRIEGAVAGKPLPTRSAWMPCNPAQAMGSETSAPAMDRTRPSVTNCRIRRPFLRAERGAHRQLAGARHRPHHDEVRHVGGRNRHQQANRQQEQRDHDPEAIAADEIADRHEAHAPPAVGARVFVGERGADRRHLGGGAIERHAVLQPRDEAQVARIARRLSGSIRSGSQTSISPMLPNSISGDSTPTTV